MGSYAPPRCLESEVITVTYTRPILMRLPCLGTWIAVQARGRDEDRVVDVAVDAIAVNVDEHFIGQICRAGVAGASVLAAIGEIVVDVVEA